MPARRETRPNTRRPVAGRQGMRNRCRSHSTRIASPTAASSKSISPSRTTRPNSIGPDVGTQYRSAMFPQNPEQSRIATAYIAQLNAAKLFPTPIVTTIEPGKEFYPAEAHHQDYLTLHPSQPYIAINDLPKIQALKELFPDSYREIPVLVAAVQSAK